jgi:hypothetical protein
LKREPGHSACCDGRGCFFEEWDDPLITGIGWVSELVEIAGGIDIFADRARHASAKDRIVTAEEVVARSPDLIIGSWCGKKFRPERVDARPGFANIPAVQRKDLYEIKSPLILQPGPAALTDGLEALQGIIERWAGAAPRAAPIGLRWPPVKHCDRLPLLCREGSGTGQAIGNDPKPPDQRVAPATLNAGFADSSRSRRHYRTSGLDPLPPSASTTATATHAPNGSSGKTPGASGNAGFERLNYQCFGDRSPDRHSAARRREDAPAA